MEMNEMPAWTTHLVTANKVLEKINIEDKNIWKYIARCK